MPVKTNSTTFVYGRFVRQRGRSPFHRTSVPPLPPGSEDFAIEVLREYSSKEFLGKLYARVSYSGDWAPVFPIKAASYDWYKWVSEKHQPLYFAMDGSGIWEVVNFRNESDESGPYVAVALKYKRE